jgi:hypothetical protein
VDGGEAPAVGGRGPAPAAVPAGGAVTERVAIGLGGLWLGPVDGPRTHYLFVRRRRTEELAQFVHAYAPFRVATGGGAGGGELAFHGRGTLVAGAAERRMITEWTRAVVVELGAGSGASPFGLVLAWHRVASTGARCDDLAVYLSGDVRAGTCGGGAEVHGRLGGERLGRFYAWVDGLQPFQDSGEQEVSADALLARLVFAGRGSRPATRADIDALASFAETLHHELASPASAVGGGAGSAGPGGAGAGGSAAPPGSGGAAIAGAPTLPPLAGDAAEPSLAARAPAVPPPAPAPAEPSASADSEAAGEPSPPPPPAASW